MLQAIVPMWPQPRRGWRHYGAASLEGAWKLEGLLMTRRAPGDETRKKPLEEQVLPSPQRVAATRRRDQWGQLKSKKSTSCMRTEANSLSPQLATQDATSALGPQGAALQGQRTATLRGSGLAFLRRDLLAMGKPTTLARRRREGLRGILPHAQRGILECTRPGALSVRSGRV